MKNTTRFLAVIIAFAVAVPALGFGLSGGSAAAEGFTPAEVTSLSKLRDSQRAVRSALLAFEVNIASKTTADTRAALGPAEHAMSETDEKLVNATYFLFGAAALRDDAQRDKLRKQPRQAYVALALQELTAADAEIAEATGDVAAAGLLRPDDAAYQLQIQRTQFFLTQATAKLALVDRTLTYATPPGSVLQYDEGFEAFGQYGYDIADILVNSWDALPAGTDFKSFAGVLSQFWLVQNGGLDVGFRSAGVIEGTADDSLDSILGGGTSSANQHLHNMMINMITLEGTSGTSIDFDRIHNKFSDCWRHMDRTAREIARQ